MSTLNGDSTDNVLTGTNSSDLISGQAGSDTLSGGNGSDLLSGGSGSDTLYGGNGSDVLLGGSGNDVLDGGNGSDLLSGGSGSDQLSGGNGTDILNGGSGNDFLDGGTGSDLVYGGSGNDVLMGGSGADLLVGGSGNDIFQYLSAADSTLTQWDRIIDFTQGKDKIDLAALLGDNTNLAWGYKSPLANGVWYLNSGSSTFVFADANGDGKADLKIELKNACGVNLTCDDFIGVGGSAPVASNGVARGNEDTEITGRLVASDADGNDLRYSIVSGPTHGSLVLHQDGSYTYTPGENFNGDDYFTFKANDGSSDSNVATVSLTVDPVNDAPVAQAQIGATGEDAVFNGTLMATDVDGDAVTYSIVSPVDGVAVNSDGTFSVTPLASQGLDDGETSTVTFQYVANDGKVNSAPATVTVTINGSNDAPVGQGLGVATDQNSVLNDKLVATDVDVETLSYSIVAPVAGVTVNPSGTFQFDPDGHYDYLGEGASADISFQYVANDGTVDSAPATVTIHITGVNDAPDAVDNVTGLNTSVGASGNVLTDPNPVTLDRDSDPDSGDTLTVTSVGGTDFGDNSDVRVTGKYGDLFMLDDGQWAYTLTNAPTGGDDEVFNYTVADQHGAKDSAMLTIHVPGAVLSLSNNTTSVFDTTVTGDTGTGSGSTGGNSGGGSSGGNTAPVAVADEANWSNGGIYGNVLLNDSDLDLGDSLVVTAVDGNPDVLGDLAFGDYGFLVMTDTGDWSYQLTAAGTDVLAQGGSAHDVFDYSIADASGATASTTLTVHIGDFIL